MKKTTLFTLLTALVLIPATLYLGSRMSGRWYYFTIYSAFSAPATILILQLWSRAKSFMIS